MYRTYAMRARLLRNFGTAANQVLWRGQVPLIGDPAFADQAILALDTWLARVEADRRSVGLARKILEDRPATVTDRCTDGHRPRRPRRGVRPDRRRLRHPAHGCRRPARRRHPAVPAEAAGPGDYDVTFTDAQWARLQGHVPERRLRLHPAGRRTSAARPSWLTYQDAAGKVVYGGRPLGPPPVSTAIS